ncbi:MAG: restriction endonuclease subunit S [Parcubacteria group bacterium CG11_big_fil_rev_8_21_14_0_20_41_14]|nr:MAG: restriction endonuclease subunit S [Parcubacteria group bacterium CG11_big_fil_rev_8_21_14_0_20_41_14]
MTATKTKQNIPRGWQTVTVQDVCENLDNLRKPVTKSDRESGDVPYYGATGIVDYVKDYIFDEPILLIGEDGADWSKFANTAYTVDGRSWVNNHAHVLRCTKADRIFLKEYLNYEDLNSFITGGTRGKLTKGALSKIPVLFPPLSEQKKIAEILGAVDEEIQKIDEIISATEKLKRGLMYDIFHFRNEKNLKFIALGDIGKVSMCKRVFKEETSDTGEIPFYKIGTFGKDPDAFISQKLFDSYRKKFSFPKVGDVLLSASGTIGRKVKYDGKPAYFQDSNIIWLEHDESKILNSFLFYLYDTITWQTEGSTIKRLYNSILLRKMVPVPSIDNQKRIVEILSAVDEKISINQRLKEKLSLLKKGLMQDLLSGSKRVNV